METSTKKRFIGHKIWYTIAIILCSVVLLFSLVGIFGTWAIEQTLARFSITLLRAAENTAGGVRQVAERVDTGITRLASITDSVSQTSSQIAQNMEDKGLVLTLLPPQKETELIGFLSSTGDSINNIRDSISGGVDLYRSINDLPLIKLPMPSEERVQEMQQSMAEVEATIQELRQSVQDFRDGVSSKIDLVTQKADQATQKLADVSSGLQALDQDLAKIQETAVELQVIIPNLLALAALLASLFLAYIVYTQVEMIILYIHRWKALGASPVVVLESSQIYELPAGENIELPATLESEVSEQKPNTQEPTSPEETAPPS